VDVVIVGAGAAGIAAARRIAAANRRLAWLEASAIIGGRCVTDTRVFGIPYDQGARSIYAPDINPVIKLTERAGFDVYRAPPGQRIRVGRRNAREGEMEDFLSALVHANRAIGDFARGGKSDMASARTLPRDLGEWRPTIDFVLGPYIGGKDLADVSAIDFANALERGATSFCRQGYGALLASLAAGLPIERGTPVTTIDWGGRGGVEIETARGTLAARAVIVTASTGVLAAGKIAFKPQLPKRQLDAIASLKLGSYDHVMLELPGNPLGLARDDLVFEKSADARTAALLANVAGTTLTAVDVGGNFGRELSAAGEAAMVAFALEWLTRLFGADVRKDVGRTHATRWNAQPWTLGAMSVAAPGGQGARKVLQETLAGRVWFAGEATHEAQWGTVAGAFESGERAADAVIKRLAAADKASERPQRGQPRNSSRRKRQ
ncbi:MAG: FAD-dependent oxidoreductase, partial [Proteobacteria bacterium]|nr:FAD-dependent oxidoreductase [Pseudomonadota bacterium]